MQTQKSEPWDLLAALRFCLAFIVMCTHFEYMKFGLSGCGFFYQHVAEFGPFAAVLCFLVVSGFSIGHSISRRTEQFYTRRWLRLYPLYGLAVLCSVPIDLIHHLGPFNSHALIANMLMLQTFRYPVIYANPVVWSVAVEASFYALAPLLNQLRTTTLLGLMLASIAAFFYYPYTHLTYYAWLRHGLPMLFLGWAWMAGFIYYRVRAVECAGMILVGGMVVVTTINATFAARYSELTLAVSMLIIVAGARVELSPLVRRLCAFLGDLSYPLYLFHVPVMYVYADAFHLHSGLLLAACCFLVSAAMLYVDALLKYPAQQVANTFNALMLPVYATLFVYARSLDNQMRQPLQLMFGKARDWASVQGGLALRSSILPESGIALALAVTIFSILATTAT